MGFMSGDIHNTFNASVIVSTLAELSVRRVFLFSEKVSS